MNITYHTGDVTKPVGSGIKIVAHICNDIGAWGAGFVLAVSRRWPETKRRYKEELRNGRLKLGLVGFVRVEPDIFVANMIAQRDICWRNGLPPIRYGSLGECLEKVATFARTQHASVHMPRIGCGLAGGTWNKIEPIIKEKLAGVNVLVYDI